MLLMFHVLTALDRITIRARCLHVPDFSSPLSPFWRQPQRISSSILFSRPSPVSEAAFTTWQKCMRPFQPFSIMRGPREENVQLLSDSSSLSPKGIFEKSPVSFGILAQDGYDDIIK